jgi:hypothetical protein
VARGDVFGGGGGSDVRIDCLGDIATDSLSRYSEQLGMYGEEVIADLGAVYLVPALVPFWFLRRMRPQERRWMLGLLAVYLCLSMLMVALLNPSSDLGSIELVARFFSASHLVLAVWAGYGLALLGTVMIRSGQPVENTCRSATVGATGLASQGECGP